MSNTHTWLFYVLPCRQLFDYDQVVNTQRDKVYSERRKALLATNLAPMMREYAERTADDIVEVSDCMLSLLGGMCQERVLHVCGVLVGCLMCAGVGWVLPREVLFCCAVSTPLHPRLTCTLQSTFP